MIEFTMIKIGSGFNYASDFDKDAAAAYKLGQSVKFTAVKQSARSLQHHRLFFGGLLELAFQYWEPDEVMTTEAERALIAKFCQSIGEVGGVDMMPWGDMFINKLNQSRSGKIDSPAKTKDGLLLWIKEKAGHYDVVKTPTGIKRVMKSINFNSMSQEQFDVFYKKAFGVCWAYILNQSFKDSNECQDVIDQLCAMG